MANSKEADQLREETRTALLNAIKSAAEALSEPLEGYGPTAVSEHALKLSEAFALVTSGMKTPSKAASF